jgi:hypothetical protein
VTLAVTIGDRLATGGDASVKHGFLLVFGRIYEERICDQFSSGQICGICAVTKTNAEAMIATVSVGYARLFWMVRPVSAPSRRPCVQFGRVAEQRRI